MHPLENESSLVEFLAAFESRTLPKPGWTHAAHLTVAACYLFQSDAATVLPKMRLAIRAYNESVGTANTDTSGYHETLTVFWLRVIDGLLRHSKPPSQLEAARLAVAAFGERRKLFAEYYSGDIVANQLARREWVAPDLQFL